jgi:RNA polymerase sigma factor (sigma-70 family)
LSDFARLRVFTSEPDMTESQKLLAQYAASGSEEAFRELVGRCINLVYSTALRLVDGDTHRAQDVAQEVFLDLARLARGLSGKVMLGGWLHRHTCFIAAKTLRRERRRQNRERQATEMNALEDHAPARFEQLAPILDEAINQLSTPDRTAIVLRFFEGQDLRSVGQALATNEDAAQKRVARALDKLRPLLLRRGVALSGAGLAVLLTSHAVAAAPAGLATSISTAVISSAAAVSGGLTLNLLKLIAMTKLKLAAGAIVIAAVGTTLVLEQRAQATLRQNNQALRQKVEQSARLNAENQRLASLITPATPRESPLDELTRLRAEAANLRQQQAQRASTGARQTAQRSPAPTNDYLTKAAYAYAGFADPDSALQTMMWAGTTGDAKTILACFPPEAFQDEMRTKAQQKQAVEVVSRCTSRWSGYRIVSRQNFGDDRMVATISYQTAAGGATVGRMKLRRVGSDWKFDGELDANTPLEAGKIQWGDGVVR